MENFILERWDKYSKILKEYFRTTTQDKYNEYSKIFQAVVKFILNSEGVEWDRSKITEIDNGDYQGTLLFIIPKETYQPSSCEYLVTSVDYGSCSYCDTLEGISDYSNDVPTEQQLEDYMTLAMHLVQKMKLIYKDEDN